MDGTEKLHGLAAVRNNLFGGPGRHLHPACRIQTEEDICFLIWVIGLKSTAKLPVNGEYHRLGLIGAATRCANGYVWSRLQVIGLATIA